MILSRKMGDYSRVWSTAAEIQEGRTRHTGGYRVCKVIVWEMTGMSVIDLVIDGKRSSF